MEGLKTLNGLHCEQIKSAILAKIEDLKSFVETHINCGEEESLLLDLYPGAAVAYSLRKLNSAYTGYCCQIIRGSDNQTKDIGFVNGVVDTAEIVSFLSSGEVAAICVFYDQSGNGNHSSNGFVHAGSPIIRDSSNNIIEENGRTFADFDNWSNGRYAGLPTGILYNKSSWSYFQVAKIKDFAGSNGGVFGPSGNVALQGIELIQYSLGGVPALMRINGTSRNNNSGAGYRLWDDDVINITSIFGNTSSISAYKNGSSVSLTDNSASPALNYNGGYTWGAYYNSAYNMYGKAAELIIYESDQSANRTGIETNINNFYSIY